MGRRRHEKESHKRECNEENHKRKHHKREEKEEKYKKEDYKQNHKRKHGEKHHKRNHLEKHQDKKLLSERNNKILEGNNHGYFETDSEKNNNDNILENNVENNNYSSSETDSGENNDDDTLENNIKDNNYYSFKNSDLENENCNGSENQFTEDKSCIPINTDLLMQCYNKVLLENLDVYVDKKSLMKNYSKPNVESIKKTYNNSVDEEVLEENNNTSENEKSFIEDCRKSLPEVHIIPLIKQNKDDNYSENVRKENVTKNYSKHEKEKSSKEIRYKSLKEGYAKNKYNEVNNKTHKNHIDKHTSEECKIIVTSEILPLCENIPYTSEITKESVTVKIPVVLTECKISINIESFLKLEDTILEIKSSRSNVYLNQCKLIPNSGKGKTNTGILFISGFIRKNIEYIAKDYVKEKELSGNVKHSIVKIPFKCTTRVKFKTQPKFTPTIPQDEVEILENNITVCDPCEENMHGREICERSFRFTEFFNEKVFCELISAEIVESDILEIPTNKDYKSPIEQTVNSITEKVVLFLTIKLLQNQYVEISKKISKDC